MKSIVVGLLVHIAAAAIPPTFLEQASHLTPWGGVAASSTVEPFDVLLQVPHPRGDQNDGGSVRQRSVLTSTVSARRLAWRAWARSAGAVPDVIKHDEETIVHLEEDSSRMAVLVRKLEKATERTTSTAALLSTRYGQDQAFLLQQQHELVQGFRTAAAEEGRRRALAQNTSAAVRTLEAARIRTARLRQVTHVRDAEEAGLRRQLAALRAQFVAGRAAATRREHAAEQELRNGSSAIARAEERARASVRYVAALKRRIAAAGADKERLRRHRAELLEEDARLVAEGDRLAGLQRGQRAALEALEHEVQDDRREAAESQHELDVLEGVRPPAAPPAAPPSVGGTSPTHAQDAPPAPDVEGEWQELNDVDDVALVATPEAPPPGWAP